MTIAESIKDVRTNQSDLQDERPRPIVVGAGFGGLAAAIRLAVGGYRVSVLEARSRPGGRAGQIVDRSFTFDTGPTLITVPELRIDLWNPARQSLDDFVHMRLLDRYYRIQFKDGTSFEYCADAHEFDQEVAKVNPADVAGYHAFLEATRRGAFMNVRSVISVASRFTNSLRS